jgi:hypothetical protein
MVNDTKGNASLRDREGKLTSSSKNLYDRLTRTSIPIDPEYYVFIVATNIRPYLWYDKQCSQSRSTHT